MGTTLSDGSVVGGRYRVVRRLGAGGMGAVYEVLDSNTNRLRALKVLLPGLDPDAEMVARFRQEATVAGRVESEHVVEVFDAGFDPEHACTYLVMELLRGEDLGARVHRSGRLPPQEALDILAQVALGLARTHAEGIVHRDLKPENLFATRRDDGSLRMKILDFGVAKVVSGVGGTPRTTRAFGTPTYMAPEQLTGDGLIDERADLYALGHVAYVLLVGEPYFGPEHKAAKNVFAFAQTVLDGAREPAALRAARAGATLPPAFDAWFARATHKDPNARFRSAQEQILELAAALGLPRPGALESREVEHAPTEPVPKLSIQRTESSAVASAPASPRKSATWFSAIAVVALVIAGGSLLFARSAQPTKTVSRSLQTAAIVHRQAAPPPAVTSAKVEPAPPPRPRPRPTATAKPYDPLDDL
jgi:serine/threonine-protein kinase